MDFTPQRSPCFSNVTLYEDFNTYDVKWINIIDVQFPLHIAAILWYFLLVVILITTSNSRLKSPYFQLFILNGTVDIINALATEYIRISQRVGLGKGSNFFLTEGLGPRLGWYLQVATAITGANFAMHLIANSLMSFYQFSALWLPWFRKLICMIIIMIVVVTGPLAAYHQLLFVEFHFAKENGLYVYTRRVHPIDEIRTLDAVLTITCSFLSAFFLVGTIYGIRKRAGDVIKQKIQEKSLVVVEIINVVFEGMETAYSFIFLLDLSADNFVLSFIYNNFLSYFFIMLILNSITLPLCTKTVRTEIVRRFVKPKVLPPRIEQISGLYVLIRKMRMPRR